MYTEKYDESEVEEENMGGEMERPFDPSQISVRQVPMSIDSILNRMEHKEIKLDSLSEKTRAVERRTTKSADRINSDSLSPAGFLLRWAQSQ